MSTLYLTIDLGSILLPLLFSFHPRIQFYKKAKYAIPGILISAAVYISWDVVFTQQGIWGFNEQYLVGLSLLHLPVEEWLFFICIPYACLFTHFTITRFYPNIRLGMKMTKILATTIILGLVLLSLLNSERAYTFFNSLLTSVILVLALIKTPELLRSFFLTFLVILIPFFIVNGILTGSFIEGEVVWYNNLENLGIRMGTIPVEDTFYAMGMILLALVATEWISGRSRYGPEGTP